MCGIAGLIHRGKTSNVGSELQQMLQALKHRGPDSTGYALYADNDGKNFILRFKVGENVGEGSSSVNEDASVYDERKKLVDQMLNTLGAKIIKEDRLTPYSFRYEMKYEKDLMDKEGKQPQVLEYEKTFWPFILISKKRYTGDKYEFEPEIKIGYKRNTIKNNK